MNESKIDLKEFDEWLLWNEDINADERELIMETLNKYFEEKENESKG